MHACGIEVPPAVPRIGSAALLAIFLAMFAHRRISNPGSASPQRRNVVDDVSWTRVRGLRTAHTFWNTGLSLIVPANHRQRQQLGDLIEMYPCEGRKEKLKQSGVVSVFSVSIACLPASRFCDRPCRPMLLVLRLTRIVCTISISLSMCEENEKTWTIHKPR
jgi:hypothetical protein